MEERKRVRILSVDGGGIRGIIAAVVLTRLEQAIRERTGDPAASVASCFDLVAGTSTGAILTAMLLAPGSGGGAGSVRKVTGGETDPSPKVTGGETDPAPKRSVEQPGPAYSAADVRDLYVTHGNEIFNRSLRRNWLGIRYLFNATRYSPAKLEALLHEKFGDLQMSQLIRPCIITAYSLTEGRALFYSSRESGAGAEIKAHLVREVVRGSTAAPLTFPPAMVRSLATGSSAINIDGGVFANNPAMCAYAEARTMEFPDRGAGRPGAAGMVMLSIGNGAPPPGSNREHLGRRRGIIPWARNIPPIMLDGALDTVSYQTELLFGSVSERSPRNYLRVDVPPPLRHSFYNADMTDASPANIGRLVEAGEAAATHAFNSGAVTLNDIVDQLID